MIITSPTPTPDTVEIAPAELQKILKEAIRNQLHREVDGDVELSGVYNSNNMSASATLKPAGALPSVDKSEQVKQAYSYPGSVVSRG